MCVVPDNITNGLVLFDSTYFESVASYKCNHGYVLDGPVNRTCQDNGMWSRQEPSCKRESRAVVLIITIGTP